MDLLTSLIGAPDGTIVDLLDARAARDPDKSFVLWEGEAISYAEALGIIRSIAGWLQSHGSASGRPRLLCYLPNRIETLWAWLGTVYAGGIFVPINPAHRGQLLDALVERAHADVILSDAEGLEAIGARGEVTTVLVGSPVAPEATAFEDLLRNTDYAPAAISPADVAGIIFTSGTTGRAKATRITHNQYVRNAARLVEGFGLGPQDVFHNWLPLCHVGGQLHMTMTAVVAGGTVALFPGFSRSRFWQDITSTNASVICGFAAVLNFIWSLEPAASDAASPLRIGIFAGIPDELRGPFEQRFGMKLGDNYGMTEIDPITLPGPQVPEGSCGMASPDVEIAILDDADNVLPPGHLGEIAVRPRAAAIMMAGYEDDDAATLACCRNLWFHSGDIGLLDEAGYLHFKGRKSGYIRRRGENISVTEIEAIMARHPAVEECAAVGVPAKIGEEDVKLVVVRRGGQSVDPADLIQFASAEMARFMVPRYVEFIDALPRTDLGKVVTGALKSTEGVYDAEG